MQLVSAKHKMPKKGDYVLRRIGAGKPFVDKVIHANPAIKCNDKIWRLEISTELNPVLLFEPCEDVYVIDL